jgi:transposase-like protein
MPASETPAADTAAIKPPRCAMCRGRMAVKRSEPNPSGGEKQTFECPKCGFVKSKVVGDPTSAGRFRAPRKR